MVQRTIGSLAAATAVVASSKFEIAGSEYALASQIKDYLVAPEILAASGVQASLTGSTAETILATITIPAGWLKANGILRLETMWSMTSSANNKTLRARIGGIGGTALAGPVITTNEAAVLFVTMMNRNSQSSQVAMARSNRSTDGLQSAGSALATAAVNTANSTTLVITGQLANSGETLSLEAYFAETYRRA